MKKNNTAFLVYLIVLIFLTIFRILQLNFAIDPITGFTQQIINDIILYCVLAIFLVFALLYYKHSSFTNNESSVKLTFTKYFALIYAFLSLSTFFVDIPNLLNEFKYLDDNPGLIITALFKAVTTGVGFLTGISLVFETIRSFIKKESYLVSVFPCFAVIIHSVLLLLTFFIKERTVVTISQNLLTLFFWIFAVEFIFSFSKYLCSSKIGNPLKETVIFAMFTSILGSITIISPIFAKNQVYYSIFDSERVIAIPLFLLATYILFANFSHIFKKN